MKTKDLIKLLQQEDPTGELECCINNTDIHFVCKEPAYYDGCLEKLNKDEKNKYYNIIGAEIISQGYKISIKILSIKDVIYNLDINETLSIKYDNEYSEKHYKKYFDECHTKKDTEIYKDFFIEYLNNRFKEEFFNLDKLLKDKIFNDFFEKYKSYQYENKINLNKSSIYLLKKQWDENVFCQNNQLFINNKK